jgi:hypothetical protein
MSYDEFEKTIKSKFNLPFEDPNYSVFKKALNEASSEYMISKSGSKSNPLYVIEKTDGSKQIDMFFDTPEDAKKYATKKSLKIIKEAKDTSATGYNINEAKVNMDLVNKNLNLLDKAADMVIKNPKGDIVAFANIVKKYAQDIKKYIINEILNEAKEGYFNQDGKEQYSKFNELDNMNAQEIMAGYVMEKQDNPEIDIKEAIKTVLKNLKKDQFYYTNYKLSGVRDLQPTEFTTTKRKPFFDQMEELDKKGTNLVDEKNKMQVVKEGLNKLQKMNEVKRMRQLAGLISEVKIEDVKSLLSDETLRNSDIGYGTGDSTGNEVSITYKNYKKLPFEDFSKLEDKYQVYEDILSSEDEPTTIQYFISDKFNSSTPSKPKPSYEDDNVFEGKKDKLKELVRKMMKEMFDGRDNLTDIE